MKTNKVVKVKENITKINAREIALKIIDSVLTEGAYANIALGKALSKNNLTDQDRRFVTELVYGTIKAKGTIDWLLIQQVSRSLAKIDSIILNILRLGIFQIYYLERIPDSAACNESVNLAKKYGHLGTVKFVNGVLRNIIRNKEQIKFPALEDNPELRVALTKQHPEWLVKRWIVEYGLEETLALCDFDNEIAPLCLRTNTLAISRDELLDKLMAEEWECEPSKWSPEGIVCTKITGLNAILAKYGQYFYIQDESSMLVGRILAPQSGEQILDLCAAPGGKTTHIAQLMRDEGCIIAVDNHEHKIELIKENAKRLGISSISTILADATQENVKWHEHFDRILVDAPCSGLGVLRRRAEARWRKTEQDLTEFPPVQQSILRQAASYLKPGGILVYSTCTLNEDENSKVVAQFLNDHDDFEYASLIHPLSGELLKELKILPHKDQIDGFYICALRKITEGV